MHACMPVHRCEYAWTITKHSYRSTHMHTNMRAFIYVFTHTGKHTTYHLVLDFILCPLFSPFLLVICISCSCLMASSCILRFYCRSLVFLRQDITKCPWLTSSLGSPGWPQTCQAPPASDSCMLGWQVCQPVLAWVSLSKTTSKLLGRREARDKEIE